MLVPSAGINQFRFVRSTAAAALSARFPELPLIGPRCETKTTGGIRPRQAPADPRPTRAAPMSELVAGSATDAGSGIGRAVALALSMRGAPVGLMDVLPDGLAELAAAVKQQGGRVATAQADV